MKIENIAVAQRLSKLLATLKGRRTIIASQSGGRLRFADRYFATDEVSDDTYTYIDPPVRDAIKALLLSAIDAEIARAETGLKALGVEIVP